MNAITKDGCIYYSIDYSNKRLGLLNYHHRLNNFCKKNLRNKILLFFQNGRSKCMAHLSSFIAPYPDNIDFSILPSYILSFLYSKVMEHIDKCGVPESLSDMCIELQNNGVLLSAISITKAMFEQKKYREIDSIINDS